MPNNSTLKMKMLVLWQILRQESDAERPLSTAEICRKLGEQGIRCERKSVATDVALLNRQGFAVETRKVGRERVYYVEDRQFSVPELKILIDAVQAATFITEKKSAEFMEKIAALGGSPLLVDTGDEEVNEMLSGYMPVIVGYGETMMAKVKC